MPVPIVHHPSYVMKIPQKQGFPIGKYGQLIQLLRDEGLATAQTLNIPEVSPVWWLELVHDSDYVDGILAQTADDNVMRRIGLPLSPELADRARMSVPGTVMAAQLALKWGLHAILRVVAIMPVPPMAPVTVFLMMSLLLRGCCRLRA